MVRSGFRGDGQAAPFCECNHFHGMTRRDVRDMKSRAGELGEQDIAGHHDVFGGCRNAAQTETNALDAFVHVAARA